MILIWVVSLVDQFASQVNYFSRAHRTEPVSFALWRNFLTQYTLLILRLFRTFQSAPPARSYITSYVKHRNCTILEVISGEMKLHVFQGTITIIRSLKPIIIDDSNNDEYFQHFNVKLPKIIWLRAWLCRPGQKPHHVSTVINSRQLLTEGPSFPHLNLFKRDSFVIRSSVHRHCL